MHQESGSKNTSVQTVPRPPLVQSQRAISDILQIETHYQPAGGTSECCLPNCLLSIHLGQPIRLKRVVDGQRSNDDLAEGDIMISPPDLHRRLSWDQDAKFLLIRLAPQLFTSAWSEDLESKSLQIIPQLKVRDPLIQQIGLTLKAELEIDGLSHRLYAESMANALAVHLIHRYSTSKPSRVRADSNSLPPPKLQQAIDYIHAHLAEDISLEALASAAGMSRYYFCRSFKRATGVTPYQYLLECRIERAKGLLLQRQQSITDIAIQVGFASQSQFGRHFKRFTGVTPNQFWQRSQ